MFKNNRFIPFLDVDNGTNLGGAGEGNGEGAGSGADNTNTNDKPLTLEDVQKMIQSETDKVRGDYSKKLKEKEKELEDLRNSTLTEQQKKDLEKKKLEESLSQREKDLLQKELTLDTIELLKENDLPLDFKDFLVGVDKETTQANIENFQKVFNSALEKAVTERFKETGKDHNESSGGSVSYYTQEEMSNMTPAEINANWDKVQRSLSQNK